MDRLTVSLQTAGGKALEVGLNFRVADPGFNHPMERFPFGASTLLF
jgi:hypothetical protein